ncbi:WPP domain-associated protein isoform X2 [Mangifera indica]|nr:WPP domain-associated protein isoform X2 [Mangifera indica]XP_044497133.1 WPP domain-associated protein isoform X2 [Mangifera indica]
MEKPVVLQTFRVGNGTVNSNGGEAVHGLVMVDDDGKESENPGNELLEDLDSYLEDINDRLTISRMVSDSVIKGMVSAVEQDAAEKIAEKELELARLKETLSLYHVGGDESELSGSSVMQHGPRSERPYSSLSNGSFDSYGIVESLGSLKIVAKNQLRNLRKEIDCIRGSCSMRRIGSGSVSEMVELGGILQDNVSDIKWMDVDKILDSLRATDDMICKQVDDMVYLSKTSLCQLQQEKEFQREIEDMVTMNCIRGLKEEFEERLWDQNAQVYDNENLSWFEKIKEISSLRQELDVISKSLSVPEIGHISSHGSTEIGEECSNNKRTDHLHRKVSGNHVSLSASLGDGNGKHDEFAVPENVDYAQLKHMSKEELVNYFKTEMTKMKRNHELEVQEMTEEYFSLKREYLRERGSSFPFKKDKEFDTLRKKIPEVVLKLDDILLENKKLVLFNKNAGSLCSLKDRLESLLSENHQLRGLITDKKREIKCLSSQVSDTAEIILQHSVAKANLLKRIGNLQCALEDACFEASITEDVYKCLLKGVVNSNSSAEENLVKRIGNLQCALEDACIETSITEDVYKCLLKGMVNYDSSVTELSDIESNSMYDFEDLAMESFVMLELCGVIFKESLKEAEEKLLDLNLKYINENELRFHVETEALQKEEALNLEVTEKERLKQETFFLSSLIEEKEKLAQEAAAALVKEKEQFALVSLELNNLRNTTRQQEMLISERSKESDEIKGELSLALEQIEGYKLELYDLRHKFTLKMNEIKDIDEERKMLMSVNQEWQNSRLLAEAEEREHKRQIQFLTILVQSLYTRVADLECRVMKDITRGNMRLDNLSSHLRALIQKAKVIKSKGLMYQQRLERRSSDLQKAEAEVDLLGDEVDALLSLLEKIYIALDHYSPVLQHYPGIVEILKLVRRELGGESTKPA